MVQIKEGEIFMENIENWIETLLGNAGVAADWLPYVRVFVLLLAVVTIAYIALLITKRLIVRILHSIFRRTAFKWDDLLVEHRVFDNLAHIVPALIIKALTPFVFADFEQLLPFVIKITDAYIVIVITM